MIFLFDFEDSFTYNILSYIQIEFPNKKVKMVEKTQVLTEIKFILKKEEPALLILGPGPGHPDQYDYLQPFISKVLNSDFIKVFGVCLGHQLIAKNLGFKVAHCTEPVHGRALKYKLPKKVQKELGLSESIEVQCYNSIAVKDDKSVSGITRFTSHGEVVLMYNSNLISYQFHPESIGTSFPFEFFKPLSEFLMI